jgi:hypothetical protein
VEIFIKVQLQAFLFLVFWKCGGLFVKLLLGCSRIKQLIVIQDAFVQKLVNFVEQRPVLKQFLIRRSFLFIVVIFKIGTLALKRLEHK